MNYSLPTINLAGNAVTKAVKGVLIELPKKWKLLAMAVAGVLDAEEMPTEDDIKETYESPMPVWIDGTKIREVVNPDGVAVSLQKLVELRAARANAKQEANVSIRQGLPRKATATRKGHQNPSQSYVPAGNLLAWAKPQSKQVALTDAASFDATGLILSIIGEENKDLMPEGKGFWNLVESETGGKVALKFAPDEETDEAEIDDEANTWNAFFGSKKAQGNKGRGRGNYHSKWAREEAKPTGFFGGRRR